MRTRLFLVSVSILAGCSRGDLFITSPAEGAVITDHEPLALVVELRGADPTRFEIEIDGVPAGELPAASPPPESDECADCTFELSWPSLEVPEGLHEITVLALDQDGGVVAANTVALVFDDAPELRAMGPQDLLGVREANVSVQVIERGALSVRVSVDGIGELLNEQSRPGADCRFGCMFSRRWNTAQLPAGPYTIRAVMEDGAGHRTESMRTMTLDDLVRVTAIQVTDEYDFSSLDMEVHVFDAANQFVGCAGNPGLEDVDASDILYNVDAPINHASGVPLGSLHVGARAIRFEVWEDDNLPCPSPAASSLGDDPLGATPNRTFADWKLQPQPMSFGTTTALAVEIGRPYVR